MSQENQYPIRIERLSPDQLRNVEPPGAPFGAALTNRMFSQEFRDGEWRDPVIGPVEDLCLSPGSVVLHYGQAIFEGMKAYRRADGGVNLFRADQNAERFNRSADRMAMPSIPVDLQLQALRTLIGLEHDWVPGGEGESLYIRPFMIATDRHLQVREGSEFLHGIILSPAGAYYPNGLKPLSVVVEPHYVRAVRGGTGEAKTGGNYAASLRASMTAKEHGHDDVVWLDALERRFVEEVGSMNIAFVLGRKLLTPSTSGAILKGVTRMSVLELAKHYGYEVEEARLDIDDVMDRIRSGRISEVFGMGTAAGIAPIGRLTHAERSCIVGEGAVGPVTKDLLRRLTDIQFGRSNNDFGWTTRLARIDG